MILNPLVQTIRHKHFFELGEFLEAGDTLIFNDTRVIPARLIGHRPSGGRIELFLLRRLDATRWETLVKPGRKIVEGSRLIFSNELEAQVIDRTEFGGRIVSFEFDGVFEEILDRLGQTPLPPYIHETLDDPERYQTVYNRVRGSAAAPTAGLHFTREQLSELESNGINLGFVTLHVGLGTFRPVRVERVEDHKMHSELYSIPQSTVELIERTRSSGRRVIAVGTTSIRTLESFARSGLTSGATDIFIYPGYEFKLVDAVITNFHLPKSTLIMLVSAFAGREFILRAYREAIAERYRFFSFGDAMFIEAKL